MSRYRESTICLTAAPRYNAADDGKKWLEITRNVGFKAHRQSVIIQSLWPNIMENSYRACILHVIVVFLTARDIIIFFFYASEAFSLIHVLNTCRKYNAQRPRIPHSVHEKSFCCWETQQKRLSTHITAHNTMSIIWLFIVFTRSF